MTFEIKKKELFVCVIIIFNAIKSYKDIDSKGVKRRNVEINVTK